MFIGLHTLSPSYIQAWIPFDRGEFSLRWNALLRICSHVYQGDWPVIVLSGSIFWLWYQGDSDIVKGVWKYYLLFSFLGCVGRGLVLILYTFGSTLTTSFSAFPVRMILSLSFLTCLEFSFLLDSILAGCIIIEMDPFFFLDLVICWHICVDSLTNSVIDLFIVCLGFHLFHSDFFFFRAIGGLNSGSYFLCRCSTTWAAPRALFCAGFF
jgi:hypothetical protein